jgi:transposase
MYGTTIFVRTPSTLNLTIGQRNGLKSFMKKTNDKKEYRRAQAVLEKSEGKTHKAIAEQHGVDERTTERWIAAYVKKGIEGLQICRNSRSKSSITDEDKEIILSALFNDPHLFGYLRNMWSLRSLAKCLTNELGVPISFKHLQRITKDLGVRCKRPKLELLHGADYEEGKERVENYKQIASALKKRGS